MSFATEKQPRRKFLGILGVGLGGLGFLSGASALESTHNLLSDTHPDTLPFTPPLEGMMIQGVSSKWTGFGAGAEGYFLRSISGYPQWVFLAPLVSIAVSATDDTIAIASDNRAGMTWPSLMTGFTHAFSEWLLFVKSADNAAIIIIGEIHDRIHTILETFEYQFAATGAGNVFATTAGIFAYQTPPSLGANAYHLKFTTVTLNGGSCVVKQRRLFGA